MYGTTQERARWSTMADLKTQVAVLVEKRLVRQVKQLESKLCVETQAALKYRAELERAQQTCRVLQLRLDVLSANTRARAADDIRQEGEQGREQEQEQGASRAVAEAELTASNLRAQLRRSETAMARVQERAWAMQQCCSTSRAPSLTR